MPSKSSKTRNYKHSGKGTRKTRPWVIFNLFLLDLLLILGFFLTLHHFQLINSSQVNSDRQVQESPKNEQTNSDSASNTDTNTNEINWVKQDTPVQIPILMYHAIHVMDPSEAENANLIVSPDVFESHLQALSDAGYYTLTPEEAYKILTENVLPENKKVVWLPFDDGMADFYTQAFPLLMKYQMRGTNNIITGFIEENRANTLTLEQMKEMKNQGMSFEDHTVTHPDLSLSSSDYQTNELSLSKHYLDTNLNQITTTVAYPSGRYSDVTLQIAESLGYKLGLTTNNGLASLSNGLFSLNRVRIYPTTTGQELLKQIATN
ncbi:Polysaccharide deacetylase [Streptococcus sp. DD10]|uniref:polysaccharide deacetylase family protein n=1 Tax=Streptococcus sp. DD10 TaxID=1777878 RepID=UPI00079AC12F|nr:polysaccharide deacetylase family protein [Streptococcus sp. DD10]KXT75098.1 Polysaccharide deacetylase [Streptococcus sp. DD10]